MSTSHHITCISGVQVVQQERIVQERRCKHPLVEGTKFCSECGQSWFYTITEIDNLDKFEEDEDDGGFIYRVGDKTYTVMMCDFLEGIWVGEVHWEEDPMYEGANPVGTTLTPVYELRKALEADGFEVMQTGTYVLRWAN